MAELVQSHMESMESEIQEMQRIKLFTAEETRILLKKRREFEYKINGVTKNLQDFKDYIQYEKIILKDIKARRNKLRIMEKKSTIEFKILNRIKYLYDIALQQFPNDYQLSMLYFNFCKESIFPQAASHVIQNMIKTFSSNEDVWKVAADWFMKKDSNQALSIIYRGLAIHKNSEKLCSKAIELELNNAGEDIEVQSLCAKRIETIVNSVMKDINNYKFLLEILQSLTQYEFTSYIQKSIVIWLLEKYKDEELVWHTLAEREFNGHHLDQHNAPTSPNYRLEKCIEFYEKGLNQICIGNKASLWCLYLDFLADLQFREDKSIQINKEQIISAFKRANDCTLLSDRYFAIWAQLLEDQTKVIEVINKGLEVVPTSVELWKLRLKYFILKDNVEQINEIVRQGSAKLEKKSLPLWLMALRYHTLNSTDGVIDKIYEQGVQKPKEISDVLKPDYIEWLALTKGIEQARTKYNSLAVKLPYCKELHVVMARIESLEYTPDIDKWERVLLLATQQFTDNVELWKMLVDLYLRHHKEFEKKRPGFDLSAKLLEVYNTAERFVKHDELLLANWKKEFDDIRNSVGSSVL